MSSWTPTQIPHATICHVTEARYVRIARKGELVNLVALEKTCTPLPWWRVRHRARVSFIALLTTNVCGTDPWTLPRLTFFNIIIHMAPVWVFSTYPYSFPLTPSSSLPRALRTLRALRGRFLSVLFNCNHGIPFPPLSLFLSPFAPFISSRRGALSLSLPYLKMPSTF